MIKKGFNLFKVHLPLLCSRGFDIEEPMCCEVCKGCLFNVGKLICKYRKATYAEVKIDHLSKILEKSKKLNGGTKMIKKGLNLFTTSPTLIEHKIWLNREPGCCDVCLSPFIPLCKPFCKHRKAELKEWLDCKSGKE